MKPPNPASSIVVLWLGLPGCSMYQLGLATERCGGDFSEERFHEVFTEANHELPVRDWREATFNRCAELAAEDGYCVQVEYWHKEDRHPPKVLCGERHPIRVEDRASGATWIAYLACDDLDPRLAFWQEAAAR